MTKQLDSSNNHDAGLTRRGFLGGSVGLGVAALTLANGVSAAPLGEGGETVPKANEKEYLKDEKFDAIVIGAGAAGLGAARRLMQENKRVVVLEARNRLGGRLWRDTTSMNAPFERGGEITHGGSDATTWYILDGAGIKLFPVNRTLSRFTPKDPWVAWGSREHYLFPKGVPGYKTVPPAKNTETAKTYLERIGVFRDNYPLELLAIQTDSPAFRDWKFSELPSGRITKTLQACIDVERGGAVPPNYFHGNYIAYGSYGRLIDIIAEGLDIRTQRAVDTIEYTDKGVTVSVGDEVYEAPQCIVAVPAAVLRNDQIEFRPGLSSQWKRALDDIHYEVAFKSILEFDHKLPETFNSMVNTYTDGPQQLWDSSSGWPDFKGQHIVGWDTGARAEELLALPMEERFAATLQNIRDWVKDPGLEYVNASNYDWRQDEFAQGAYPFGPRDSETLYTPVKDTLFWAGMVTSTISSSYDSGIDAAEAILKGWSQVGHHSWS